MIGHNPTSLAHQPAATWIAGLLSGHCDNFECKIGRAGELEDVGQVRLLDGENRVGSTQKSAWNSTSEAFQVGWRRLARVCCGCLESKLPGGVGTKEGGKEELDEVGEKRVQ